MGITAASAEVYTGLLRRRHQIWRHLCPCSDTMPNTCCLGQFRQLGSQFPVGWEWISDDSDCDHELLVQEYTPSTVEQSNVDLL